MKPAPLARVLPREVALQLQQAAATENSPVDPLARQKAIEKVTRRIKQQYPKFFRSEKE